MSTLGLGHMFKHIVREAATPVSFIQQLTEKDNEVLSENRPMIQKLKDTANIITGRMSGFHIFNSPADYKPPFTFNLAGLANKWTGFGLGMIIYSKIAKDMKILPHGGYIGSIGKRLLTGGAVGGVFDAPAARGNPQYTAPQPVEYQQRKVPNVPNYSYNNPPQIRSARSGYSSYQTNPRSAFE